MSLPQEYKGGIPFSIEGICLKGLHSLSKMYLLKCKGLDFGVEHPCTKLG